MGTVGNIHQLQRCCIALILAVLTVMSPRAYSQNTPTAQQLEALGNLPPEQQRALLDAVRNGGSAADRRDTQLTTPQTSVFLPQPPVEEGPPRITGGATLLLAVKLEESATSVATDRRNRVLAD